MHITPAGRKPGSLNERTKQWDELGKAILEGHAERANTVLASLDDEKFIDQYCKLLEYFRPKLQRSEVKQDTGPVEIRIVRDYNGTTNSAQSPTSEPTEDN
jgi:hypothetical protein